MQEYILSLYKEWETKEFLDLVINEDIRGFERRQLTQKLSDVFTEVIKENN